ncbi:MAG TPA: hypothetical protein VF799_12965 [Geobacteraceae bacterium]
MEADKVNGVAAMMYYGAQPPTQGQATKAQDSASADTQGTSPTNDQVQLTTPSATLKSLETAKTIGQIHAYRNQLVSDTRTTADELNRATGWLDQMQTNLAAVIKNYPPYPLEDTKRKDLLMSYSSIREQIIKMTVPVPPAPVYEKVKGMWSSLFGQNGQILPHAVPGLHAVSSDSEVQAASATLGTTSNTLAAVSDGVTQALARS